MKYGKIWGSTELIFRHNGVECHRIFIKKGFACSKHKHDVRDNAFYVESGDLIVQVWKNDYNLVDNTRLKNGMRTGVSAGEHHCFVALEDTIALEWYWVKDITQDIERINHGQKVSNDEIKKLRKI